VVVLVVLLKILQLLPEILVVLVVVALLLDLMVVVDLQQTIQDYCSKDIQEEMQTHHQITMLAAVVVPVVRAQMQEVREILHLHLVV
jgi:Tfp pilus assembly protein PilO